MVDEHDEGRNFVAVVFLMFANTVMTINQGNIPAVYLQISQEFGQGVVGLGFLTSNFFLAYALFELPGGFIAAKFGPKKLVLVGTAISAFAVICSGLSPVFYALAIFRFVAGLGSGLAYPSTLVLIVRYFKRGSSGLGIGFMSISSSIGGLVGLFGWAVLSDVVGWRFSVLSGGLLGVAALLALVFLLPKDTVQPNHRFQVTHLKRIIFNRFLTAMAFANFGLGATVSVVTSFMVFYMEYNFGASPVLAGGVVGLGLAIPLLTNPLFGRAYDRMKNHKALFLVASATASASVAVAAIKTLPAVIFTALATRPAQSGATILALSTARELGAVNSEYESATVAWVDTFFLLGNFAAPIYFPFLAVSYGYPIAWLLGGSVAILFSLPTALMTREKA